MNQSNHRSKSSKDWYNEKFVGIIIMQEDKVKQLPTQEGIMELTENYSKLI